MAISEFCQPILKEVDVPSSLLTCPVRQICKGETCIVMGEFPNGELQVAKFISRLQRTATLNSVSKGI